ncbi:hypothetical protein G7047_14705 [Diaphorobacter sp. HDW4A]|uniref:hypothetical protein n=1 Tax=Diaphorobacter sp. HDW4A TaxID=2714924 RepID=UPI0014082D3B|nr:hypothetical protein [Diaphorobacter sp. HDW4A]QIL81006.1 hypothetical protein G7047_14705 [Diaphorobacter sp. HDW4A]
MSKKPMFKLHPDGEQYIITLPGVVLLCGSTIYGDPTETTPQGRTNAMRLVERTLQEAEKYGFKQPSTVWALLRRNEPNQRLNNLVQEAVDLIPKHVQAEVMRAFGCDSSTDETVVPLVTAMKHPGRHEPETNPRFLRPGPDGVDPRFWSAGRELKRIAANEGPEAIHKPEYAHLYSQMLRYAPKDLQAEMRAKAEELDLMPKATHVNEHGEPVFSIQQIAEKHGVSVEEVEQLIAQSDIDPDDLYTGPVFPKQ